MWVDELKPNHLMTHLPKSRSCDTCLQAKLYENPHRRRENQRETLQKARDKEEPSEHMERISADFIVASDSIGIGGQSDALVLVDRFSGLIGVHPCNSRSADDAEEGLRHFCGKDARTLLKYLQTEKKVF